MPSEVVTDHAPTYRVVLEELLPAAWERRSGSGAREWVGPADLAEAGEVGVG
jgi:uncharacterized protein (DUF736 family)